MKTDNNIITRATGLLIIEVRNSNPNGDPDRESDPRYRSHDQRGYITGVSFKRKLRDLVEATSAPVWQELAKRLSLPADGQGFAILESRGRNRDEIKALSSDEFKARYWDARVFGNTFLESLKDDKSTTWQEKEHFIRSGVAQFGVGVSVAPVRIERWTQTNKSGVQEGKDRGMAPLGSRVVLHGVYCMPFFINPTAAQKSGCSRKDIALLLTLIRPAYPETKSVIRDCVEVRHAWYAEHKDSLGSFSEFDFIDALTPRRKGDSEKPSVDNLPLEEQYEVPKKLPEELAAKVANFCDLAEQLPDWCR
ncbi:MAG: type I CRISPR-associated protein Cas7 [Armatimonadetes bacterium]|nr:type I CRISPR-associated protein Cas7 [Armatimonadota bacterium]